LRLTKEEKEGLIGNGGERMAVNAIRRALESNDLDAVAAAIRRRGGALSVLVRASYDKETLAGRRAIRAMGLIAREPVRTDPAFLRDAVRKLLWSLNDESGSIGWSAPELLGEIVSADPEQFPDIIPLITAAYDAEEETFRPGVLYALARIADVSPGRILDHLEIVTRGLGDRNPEVRVNALEVVERVWSGLDGSARSAVAGMISRMANDPGEAWVYRGDAFQGITVGEKVREVIGRYSIS